MKRRKLVFALMALALLCLTGCVEDYSILVSTQDLRFGLEAESQTMIVNANCKWEVIKNDDADWYTVSPMSGRAKDSVVTITVEDYSGGDFRGSSFVISSPGGHIRRTVFVSQNKLDFDGMINKVFGLIKLEHWNTDFFGQIVEDSYETWEFDPYDTTRGQLMYFFEHGQGVQRNRELFDHAIYFPFEYEYDADSSILHIVFHLVNDSLEPYNPEVLCASDSLYRFMHEYKPDFFERADMRKVGTCSLDDHLMMRSKLSKRKQGGPIFMQR